ncbi:hypothetical protein Sjap_018808 [Stephania japonica]|uniref:Uncharacterized protein n=1 Tax=Stephania japonica TaxID=461633 RepID=A0AAP0I8X6_9MAGN
MESFALRSHSHSFFVSSFSSSPSFRTPSLRHRLPLSPHPTPTPSPSPSPSPSPTPLSPSSPQSSLQNPSTPHPTPPPPIPPIPPQTPAPRRQDPPLSNLSRNRPNCEVLTPQARRGHRRRMAITGHLHVDDRGPRPQPAAGGGLGVYGPDRTGLGDRIATYFVKWLGKSTLGLSYGLTVSEALIAPAMPSTTARAGGVFLPIIKSLSLSAGSRPGHASAKRLGAYLVQSQFQAGGNSSALFLTAAAQNLLCLKLAEELGVKIASPWISWFKAASLPAFCSLLATPFILYKIFPPEIKDTPDAPAMAEKKLEQMGPVTKSEWVMIGTMLFAVSLWIFGDAIGISSVVAAMLGLSILLLLGVLNWDDCLSEKSAWDTLAWFAVLVGMAGQLTNLGIVTWMSGCVAKILHSLSLSWPSAFVVLQAAYFFIHYLFASQTGHVGALYSAFLAMHLASGVPGTLAALALAFNTNLFGALTHYSSGQVKLLYIMESGFRNGHRERLDLGRSRDLLVEVFGPLLSSSSSLTFSAVLRYLLLFQHKPSIESRIEENVKSFLFNSKR